MRIVNSVIEMQRISRNWQLDGLRIGFVPTMGYLHAGHLSLIESARRVSDRVIVSIYVNPSQFGEGEDFASYPRDFKRDEFLCREHGVSAIFYPSDSEMYCDNASTWVNEESLSLGLCGCSRVGHFRGVTTIVCKLFNATRADVAVFGQKDAQQSLVIKRMVRDLNIPIEVIISPIVRESDGLALSSRNRYLSKTERCAARSIYRGLGIAYKLFLSGECDADVLCMAISKEITDNGGSVDYVVAVSCDDLSAIKRLDTACLIAVAAYFGKTRLIDNYVFEKS